MRFVSVKLLEVIHVVYDRWLTLSFGKYRSVEQLKQGLMFPKTFRLLNYSLLD